MWKKDDPTDQPTVAPKPEEKMPRQDPSRPGAASSERATIGSSITIRGDVSGDEDLLIQGRVDGSVDLKQQSVTVGREGRVKANIAGRVLIVEGEVEGDLKAEEQVILRSTAKVQGDITAPRVVLEDGANFRGGVDMGDPSGKGKKVETFTQGQAKKDTEVTTGSSETVKSLSELGKSQSELAEKAAT